MSDPVIPSIEEIRASTEILSPRFATATVVKVGQNLVVKYGLRLSQLEADNQKFVSENSSVPVPKLLATLKDPETGCLFFVMEHVDGQGLGEIWQSLTPTERLDVGKQIQTALENLRKIPVPGYFGGLDRRAIPDGIFWTGEEEDPEISGPFATEEKLNEGIIRRLERAKPAPSSYISLMRSLISEALQGHHAVFTHADLQPKNILVSRIGTKDDGSGEFKITIIDWEVSGWYPDYWEFCNATMTGRFKPDWLELVRQIMPTYQKEYLMLQMPRNILFY